MTTTATRTRSNARKVLAVLVASLAMVPSLAAAGGKGSTSMTINLVGDGWAHIAAMRAGKPASEETPAQAAAASVAEHTRASLERVYGPEEVRRILDQVRAEAIVVGQSGPMLTSPSRNGWIEAGDGVVLSL